MNTAAVTGTTRRSRRSRRLAHNAVIVAGAALGMALLAPLLPGGLPASQTWSIVLGYASFGLLALTLAIGPRNVLLGRRNPVSTDLRRDVGIWAGVTGLAHVLFAIQHHLGGNVVKYFFDSGRPSLGGLRTDKFGLGNDLGLAATLILVLLLAISNDRALRKLGRRWKAWQRLNYGLAGLVVLHMAVFWLVESRAAVVVAPALAATVGMVALQLLGVRRHRLDKAVSGGRPRRS